jgi:hypothetical protein
MIEAALAEGGTYQGVISLLPRCFSTILDEEWTVRTLKFHDIAPVRLDGGDLRGNFWDRHPVIPVPIRRLVILEVRLWRKDLLSGGHASQRSSEADKR